MRDGLIVRQVEEDFVVYDPITDRTALLNPSAALVFDLCDGTRMVQEIVEQISILYRTSPGSVAAEIHYVLADLTSQGFLVPGGFVPPTGSDPR